jgi:hypothetical protein
LAARCQRRARVSALTAATGTVVGTPRGVLNPAGDRPVGALGRDLEGDLGSAPPVAGGTYSNEEDKTKGANKTAKRPAARSGSCG